MRGILLWQGAVAREWLTGVGRPLSAEAFAPLLRRPGLDFTRLAASARGGAFLGGPSAWGRRRGGGRGAGPPSPGPAPGAGRPTPEQDGAAPGARAGALLGGHFDMERPPLRAELRAECPLDFPRPSLADVSSGAAKPYLFGGQRPGCAYCNDPVKARSLDPMNVFILSCMPSPVLSLEHGIRIPHSSSVRRVWGCHARWLVTRKWHSP